MLNAYSSLPSAINQSARLKEEFMKLGVECDVRKNDAFALHIGGDGEIKSGMPEYGFCVYLDKDKYVSSLLERKGLRLFNRAAAIEACDDKMTTHIALAERGIAMPETVPGLLCYDPDREVGEKTLDILENKLGYPLVAKACYGSLGREVFKIDNRAQLKDIAEKLKCRSHLFQKFVSESAGRDIRVIVIGGKAAAAMERVSNGDFRSNIELGGTGKAIEISSELEKICVRTAEILNLDYCGIDILEGKNGYLLCEVNSNAFFGGIERATGVNVAKLYAEHILETI